MKPHPSAPFALAALSCAAALLFSGCHQIHEARARKLGRAALERFQKGDHEQALEQSAIALRLGLEEPVLHRVRASIRMMQGDASEALAETDAALAMIAGMAGRPEAPAPEVEAEFHALRAMALMGLGRASEAALALEEALRLHPRHVGALNNRAWLMATSLQASLRDGPAAVELATLACQLTGWKEPGLIDTLAAALAEAGDFEAAAKRQEEALERERDRGGAAEIEGFERRLELYRNGEPYREDPRAEFEQRSRSAP